MIELDERDIKSIANGRFTRRWRWYFIGYLAFCTMLLGVIVVGTVRLGWAETLMYIPAVMFLVGFGFWGWRLDKAERRLVEEWKKDNDRDNIEKVIAGRHQD